MKHETIYTVGLTGRYKDNSIDSDHKVNLRHFRSFESAVAYFKERFLALYDGDEKDLDATLQSMIEDTGLADVTVSGEDEYAYYRSAWIDEGYLED